VYFWKLHAAIHATKCALSAETNVLAATCAGSGGNTPQHRPPPPPRGGGPRATATSMMNAKKIIKAPATQIHPMRSPRPVPVCWRKGKAGGQTGGFPVGFPHWEQNAASFGNSMAQCVQFMLAMKLGIGNALFPIITDSRQNRNRKIARKATQFWRGTALRRQIFQKFPIFPYFFPFFRQNLLTRHDFDGKISQI